MIASHPRLGLRYCAWRPPCPWWSALFVEQVGKVSRFGCTGRFTGRSGSVWADVALGGDAAVAVGGAQADPGELGGVQERGQRGAGGGVGVVDVGVDGSLPAAARFRLVGLKDGCFVPVGALGQDQGGSDQVSGRDELRRDVRWCELVGGAEEAEFTTGGSDR